MCQFEYLQLRDFEQRGALKQKLHCKNGHFGPKVPPLEGIELQSGPTSRLSRWGFVSRFKVGFVFTLFFIFDTPQYSFSFCFRPCYSCSSCCSLLLLPPAAPSFCSLLRLIHAAPSCCSLLLLSSSSRSHCLLCSLQASPSPARSGQVLQGLVRPRWAFLGIDRSVHAIMVLLPAGQPAACPMPPSLSAKLEF